MDEILIAKLLSTLPDIVPIGINSTPEADGAVAMEELLEEGGAWQPHPGSRVDRPISVQQQLVENLNQSDNKIIL